MTKAVSFWEMITNPARSGELDALGFRLTHAAGISNYHKGDYLQATLRSSI